MPKRSDKPRFKVGDRVEVLSTIMSRFSGRTGVIIAVGMNQYARNLDKYTVRFEDPSINVFWESNSKAWDPLLRRATHLSLANSWFKPQLACERARDNVFSIDMTSKSRTH